MRALLGSFAMSLLLAGAAQAQAPSFLKVDIVGKTMSRHFKCEDGPTEVHIRVPISLAKGFLDMAGDGDIKVNGKNTKNLKMDQIVKLLEASKPGDLLLELTTDKGDLVKITVQ